MPPPSSHKPLSNVPCISDPSASPMVRPDSTARSFAAQQGFMHAANPQTVGDVQSTPGSYQVGMSDEPIQFTGRMPPRNHVGMSDEPLQFTGRMPPHTVDSSFHREPPPHIANSGMRPPFPSSAARPPPVSENMPGAGSFPVGMSDEPLQFTGRIPLPRVPESSYQRPQRLPDSGVHAFSTNQSLNSAAVSIPVQTLRPPIPYPPRLQPPFTGMPPRPNAPPQMGSGLPVGMPPADSMTGVGARLRPPFPGGTALHHPVDSSISMPGSNSMHPPRISAPGTMLPPPALRQPFFTSVPNMVSC